MIGPGARTSVSDFGWPESPAGLSRRSLGALAATLLIAGCASSTGARGSFDTETNEWSGRLALSVASEPPQSFSAGFRLTGHADAGELSLTSPLGNILAVLEWQPGQAVLRQGDQTRQFASAEAMAAELTGAPIPVRALFAWLRGQPEPVEGWQADLTQLPSGRLNARREMPLPTAELRIVLDR